MWEKHNKTNNERRFMKRLVITLLLFKTKLLTEKGERNEI